MVLAVCVATLRFSGDKCEPDVGDVGMGRCLVSFGIRMRPLEVAGVARADCGLTILDKRISSAAAVRTARAGRAVSVEEMGERSRNIDGDAGDLICTASMLDTASRPMTERPKGEGVVGEWAMGWGRVCERAEL